MITKKLSFLLFAGALQLCIQLSGMELESNPTPYFSRENSEREYQSEATDTQNFDLETLINAGSDCLLYYFNTNFQQIFALFMDAIDAFAEKSEKSELVAMILAKAAEADAFNGNNNCIQALLFNRDSDGRTAALAAAADYDDRSDVIELLLQSAYDNGILHEILEPRNSDQTIKDVVEEHTSEDSKLRRVIDRWTELAMNTGFTE